MIASCGSSPLARGLHIEGVAEVHEVRIIPARAGFTMWIAPLRRRQRDHPRSRGVYGLTRLWSCGVWGSSPLARGLQDFLRDLSVWIGIIPARAGFTSGFEWLNWARKDHPRSRGVYLTPTFPRVSWRGSSPLARGLPVTPFSRIPRTGIIPARAGFTGI